MQISNNMYYFTSLEVSWLVHVADWEWPLRKYINYLLQDVSCWSQVMDPCLPFLMFIDYTCYSVLMCIWPIECIRLGRFIELSNDLITSELSFADNIWWCKWLLCEWSFCVRRGRWGTALLVTSSLAGWARTNSIVIMFASAINENIVHTGIELYILSYLSIILPGILIIIIFIIIIIVNYSFFFHLFHFYLNVILIQIGINHFS